MLDNASVDGIVRELRDATTTASPTTSTRSELKQFEAAASGRFSGVGLSVSGVKRGLRVATVSCRTRRRSEPGSRRAT